MSFSRVGSKGVDVSLNLQLHACQINILGNPSVSLKKLWMNFSRSHDFPQELGGEEQRDQKYQGGLLEKITVVESLVPLHPWFLL